MESYQLSIILIVLEINSEFNFIKGSEEPGIVQRTSDWLRLDDRGVGVRVQVGSRIFSLPRRPASYPMGTGGSFLGGKAAGA
jgi:hypothetical protein